ncbi:MAG: cobyrinate a,c-diamide synthase [Armatimonadota bacterium]
MRVAGVILNRWNPMRSRTAVERAMGRAGVPILGYLPPLPEISLPSRHLGLVVADEMRAEVVVLLERLGALVTEYINLETILSIAREGGPLCYPAPPPTHGGFTGLRIAVARDEAFAFYYPDNIELLEQAGAEIRYFSPIADAALPETDGLYFGGGYPELHARRLSENTTMRRSIAAAFAGGLPIYAECGGLLYLCETLTDGKGACWPMVGAVPQQARMHRRLQRMGYREGVLYRDSLLGPAGTALRGHVFHYSSCEPADTDHTAYLLDGTPDGYCAGNLLASYQHLHFAGCPQVVAGWLTHCREYADSRLMGVTGEGQ